ncbi:valine--tRNA ligase [Methanobrevibacter cuticularis]|uniref:Leucine--tRNA ligase n=1 Tax=Methanobrevibacter cuticularis TaxID=47311 RepID=A0A166EC11_9EURY|nr:leucine--tRNA ligase [Methanobrevibacter cuticularis]KZX16491.1 valine--tRNA ligase [Methanobrevibacter cuticularis]
MSKNIEKKWQEKWKNAKLFQSDPDEREKLFLTVAYPYPSGAMHIGHGRTYTVPDVYARFKRMQGYNVLFPMGWHVTGAPVIGIASRIKEKDSWTLDLYENVHKVPKDTLSKLSDPEFIVKYFSNEYHEVMDAMGYSIDWRREFRTTDPSYQKFIEWQLKKLKSMDLVKKGKHAVKYCPKDDNPVGDHDLLEGESATINELTLLKFEIDGKYLVPATFRPETIFGATNLWLNPDVEYIEVNNNDETWIISEKAYYNLSNQIKDLKIIGKIDPNTLISKMVKNPVTGTLHPILPASFVDPEYGSGSVFSVPGHAPADYIALQDLKNNAELLKKYDLVETVANIEPINVVTLKKYSDIPARDVIERLRVKNQEDPKLEEATNELYKVEHSKGIISSHIPDYAGERVAIARDEIRNSMINASQASMMYDFSQHPVICRCGNRCVVKIMDDQWFLKYSDEEWKEKTRDCLSQETIIPPEVKSNFEYYIGWLEDWACSRRIGLGTKLPWDKQWLIEPLTDSTIYMSYYTIAKYLKKMDAEKLNDAFFDKIFLNKSSQNNEEDLEDIKFDKEIVKEIQDEFDYWYPLDWRLSAKDLVGNHLSFHLFHHATIFPKKNWPNGTVVFGMGLLEGNKMSSSKGNVIILSQAIEEYGADVVRLFLMSSAEPWQDFDWREKEVKGTKRRLEWFFEFAEKIEKIKGSPINISSIEKVELNRDIDFWMMSQLNLRLKDATIALEGFQTRKALQDSLFLLKKDLDHYMYRVKHLLDKKDEAIIYVLSTVLKTWIKILAPFTPHTCEEIWETHGGEGFLIEEEWPQFEECLINDVVQKSEEIIQNMVKDIIEIKKIVDVDPKIIHIYPSPDWKWDIYEIANEVGKPDIGQIIGKSMKANLHDDKKELSEFAKKIAREMTKTNYTGKIDEIAVLNDAKDFIEEEISGKIIIHEDNSYDPENKARNAMPYKPAIYLE